MRWLGQAKRCIEIAQAYVENREGFGIKLADRESVQIKLGQVAQQIQIGRLLTMHAAWKLDQGDRARKEVSMAKVHVADTLHNAADVAIQLNGARGFSKDTILEWIYRAARSARLVDGATEVHMMVLARFMRQEGRDFWSWGKGEGEGCPHLDPIDFGPHPEEAQSASRRMATPQRGPSSRRRLRRLLRMRSEWTDRPRAT